MTLPWVVITAAIIYFVLWKSGLFDLLGTRRSPRPPTDRLPEKTGREGDRLKVFDEFLRGLEDDDKRGQPPKNRPRDPG